MATVPQPEEFSLLAKWGGAVLGGVATIAAGLFSIVVRGFDTRLKEIDLKISAAVSKDEMREHLREDKETHAEFRETMKTLFANAEHDRAVAAQHHVELVQLIHEKFNEVRDK